MIDFAKLDCFGVEDVLDVCCGVPIFRDFGQEDWTMLALRFELHLLAHAVRRDAADPERPGIHVDHLAFYYNKYYKRTLSAKDYGVESFKDLIDLIDDTVYLTAQ